jgi:hypothetical protein
MTCRLEILTPIARSIAISRRHGHLPLVVLHQHEAVPFRPEVPADAWRQRRNQGVPIRRDPALAPITDDPDPLHQILHDEILVALKRDRWYFRLDDHVLKLTRGLKSRRA